jgi:putative restriction endonuclease
VHGYVAPTDRQWFEFLSRREPDEVNFWTPSGRGFAALRAGEPFFFKLKSPESAIGGFGIFSRAEVLPLWLAWESFGAGNGTPDERTLTARIAANRALSAGALTPATPIGCRLLSEPVFLPRDLWVRAPDDWQRSIVSGKRYDVSHGEGLRIWRECLERAGELRRSPGWVEEARQQARFGRPTVIRPRLGQGGFRLAVFDAYDRACCVTSEHSLPVLEAAHIRPYAEGGEHAVSNGLPLRRDLHRLFDLGYVTITPDLTFLVGERLRVEFHNGRSYYQLHGSQVRIPQRQELRPSPEALAWHNEAVFRAS